MNRRMTAVVCATLVLSLPVPEAVGQAADPIKQNVENQEIVGIVSESGRIVLTNMGSRNQTELPNTPLGVPTVAPFMQLINDISRQHNVDPQLTEAVIEVESAFDPNAISSMGALGLMQLIPSTGERFGVNNFFDPADNIDGGVRFLSFLIDKFQGNTDLVLAAYNSGENRVERLGRVPAIPETVDYVRKVRRAWERLRGSSLIDATLRFSESSGPGRTASAIYRIIGDGGVLKLSNIGAN